MPYAGSPGVINNDNDNDIYDDIEVLAVDVAESSSPI